MAWTWQIDAYVNRLRNPAKRAYAEKYVTFLLSQRYGAPVPEPERGALSVMGAQAVRLRLAELMEVR
jgi:hypothetical protein